MNSYSKLEKLSHCEQLLSDDSDCLLRLVKNHHLDEVNGTLTTKIFLLSTNDDGKLSHFRQNKTDARSLYVAAHNHHADELVGVWGVPLFEIKQLGLRAIDDSECEADLYHLGSHCYLDFRGLQLTKMGKKQLRADLLHAMKTKGRLAP